MIGEKMLQWSVALLVVMSCCTEAVRSRSRSPSRVVNQPSDSHSQFEAALKNAIRPLVAAGHFGDSVTDNDIELWVGGLLKERTEDHATLLSHVQQIASTAPMKAMAENIAAQAPAVLQKLKSMQGGQKSIENTTSDSVALVKHLTAGKMFGKSNLDGLVEWVSRVMKEKTPDRQTVQYHLEQIQGSEGMKKVLPPAAVQAMAEKVLAKVPELQEAMDKLDTRTHSPPFRGNSSIRSGSPSRA